MKIQIILIFSTVLYLSCNQLNSNHNKTESNKVSNIENPYHLKTKSEYDEIFLDGGVDKVINLLGSPDAKGESRLGDNGYYIYYEKVWDDGMAKHLVISYHDQKVNRIKTAIFGDRITVPAGNLIVKKPIGYQSEGNSVKNEMQKIDKFYTELDTIKTIAYTSKDDGIYYKIYSSGNLILLKEILPMSDNNRGCTEYLFINGKVRFKYYYDKKSYFITEKVYISYSGNVIKYLRNNIETSCDKNEYCKYDELSTPYYELRRHRDN